MPRARVTFTAPQMIATLEKTDLGFDVPRSCSHFWKPGRSATSIGKQKREIILTKRIAIVYRWQTANFPSFWGFLGMTVFPARSLMNMDSQKLNRSFLRLRQRNRFRLVGCESRPACPAGATWRASISAGNEIDAESAACCRTAWSIKFVILHRFLWRTKETHPGISVQFYLVRDLFLLCCGGNLSGRLWEPTWNSRVVGHDWNRDW
jgi:hypothetical protein